MRNIVLTIICGLGVFSLAYFGNFLKALYVQNKDIIDPRVILNSPAPSGKPANLTEIDGYKVSWVLANPENIQLFTNLENQETAHRIKTNKQCPVLVNGGFYSKDDRPIGLLISEGEKIQDQQDNKLFNGIFSIANSEASIQSSPLINARLAVQSGPVLIKAGKVVELALQNDEQERRVVAATTQDGKVLFLVLYLGNSAYIGPKLADAPTILKKFSEEKNIAIKDAVNLDGGTASAFYAEGISLGELTKIGSYFCIRN